MNREKFINNASTFLGKEMSARDTETFIIELQSFPEFKEELFEMENTIDFVHSFEDELQNKLQSETQIKNTQHELNELKFSSLSEGRERTARHLNLFSTKKSILALAACISIAFISGWMFNPSSSENTEVVKLADNSTRRSNSNQDTKLDVKLLVSKSSHSHYSLANCLRVLSTKTSE